MNSRPDWLSIPDNVPGVPLRYMAYLIAERRLQVRMFTHRGETVAIAVTNAHDPGRSRVNVRYDGRLNWAHNRNIETPAEIAKTRDAIVGMLTAGTDGDKGTVVSP
jgi:hypothetical protein